MSDGCVCEKGRNLYSSAREQKSLGRIGVRHGGCHVALKVLVRHVLDSRPAPVALSNFRFPFISLLLLFLLLFCNKEML